MRPRHHRVSLILAGVAGFAALGASRSASACSLVPPPVVIDSLPQDGATGVPLDVRPIIIGNVVSVDVKTGEGTPVELEVDQRSQGVVVLFKELLAVETEYRIEVGGEVGDGRSLTFTTGVDSLGAADVPAVSDLVVESLVAEAAIGWIFMCDSPSRYLCLGATVPPAHTLAVDATTDHDDIDSMLLTPGLHGAYAFPSGFYSHGGASQSSSLMASKWEPSTCVRAYLQDLAGNRGPLREVCPDDFPVYRAGRLGSVSCDGGRLEFEENPTAGQESDRDAPPVDPAEEPRIPDPGSSLQGVDDSPRSGSGCSAAPGPSPTRAAGLASLLALGALRRRRRR